MTNKRYKNGRDGPKVMVYPKMLWDKRKEVSHIRGLPLNPEAYFNLKGS